MGRVGRVEISRCVRPGVSCTIPLALPCVRKETVHDGQIERVVISGTFHPEKKPGYDFDMSGATSLTLEIDVARQRRLGGDSTKSLSENPSDTLRATRL